MDDSLKARLLNFDDISLTLSASKMSAEDDKSKTEAAKLREEMENAERALAKLDAVKQQAEMQFNGATLTGLKDEISQLESEYIDLAARDLFIKHLEEGTLGSFCDGSSIDDDDEDANDLKTSIETAKASTCNMTQEIQDIIKTIVKDAENLEAILKSSRQYLEDYEKGFVVHPGNEIDEEIARLKERIDDCYWERLQVEWQTEAKGKELKELERIQNIKNKYQQETSFLESLKGISVKEISNGYMELQLKTFLPSCFSQTIGEASNTEFISHQIQLKIDNRSRSLQQVKLVPEDIDINDILQAINENSATGTQSLLEAIDFLITQIRQRIISSYTRASSSLNGIL